MRALLAAIKERALATKSLLPFEEVVQIVKEYLGREVGVGAPSG